jgi:hypothetical protein
MFTPWDDSVKVRRDLFVKVTTRDENFIAFWEMANREPLFPLYWSADHYAKSLTCEELECGFLDDDDAKTFNNLHDFVTSQGMAIHCRDIVGSTRASPAECLCIYLFSLPFSFKFLFSDLTLFNLAAQIMTKFSARFDAKAAKDAKGKGEVDSPIAPSQGGAATAAGRNPGVGTMAVSPARGSP